MAGLQSKKTRWVNEILLTQLCKKKISLTHQTFDLDVCICDNFFHFAVLFDWLHTTNETKFFHVSAFQVGLSAVNDLKVNYFLRIIIHQGISTVLCREPRGIISPISSKDHWFWWFTQSCRCCFLPILLHSRHNIVFLNPVQWTQNIVCLDQKHRSLFISMYTCM